MKITSARFSRHFIGARPFIGDGNVGLLATGGQAEIAFRAVADIIGPADSLIGRGRRRAAHWTHAYRLALLNSSINNNNFTTLHWMQNLAGILISYF